MSDAARCSELVDAHASGSIRASARTTMPRGGRVWSSSSGGIVSDGLWGAGMLDVQTVESGNPKAASLTEWLHFAGKVTRNSWRTTLL